MSYISSCSLPWLLFLGHSLKWRSYAGLNPLNATCITPILVYPFFMARHVLSMIAVQLIVFFSKKLLSLGLPRQNNNKKMLIDPGTQILYEIFDQLSNDNEKTDDNCRFHINYRINCMRLGFSGINLSLIWSQIMVHRLNKVLIDW
jgi:hypothetical protein